ncbi:MAG: hypothetical protein AAFV54_08575 [Pseudomonadota bacterium]
MVTTNKIDDAAFGAIYGSISVMGILAATPSAGVNPLVMAGTLLTSILAVTLAKAYADLAATILEAGRPASVDMITAAWAHARTTLIAINLPTAAFLLSGMGLYEVGTAVVLAQIFAVGLLIYYGARIGLRLTGRLLATCLGGAFTGAIGLTLALLKNLIH